MVAASKLCTESNVGFEEFTTFVHAALRVWFAEPCMHHVLPPSLAAIVGAVSTDSALGSGTTDEVSASQFSVGASGEWLLRALFLVADADGDGLVGAQDARQLIKEAVEGKWQRLHAALDANGDGMVDVRDVSVCIEGVVQLAAQHVRKVRCMHIPYAK